MKTKKSKPLKKPLLDYPVDPIEGLMEKILLELGETPAREGLLRTPARYAKAMRFLTQGYEKNPKEIIEKALFKDSCNEIVLVRDIEFFSLCEHHLLPFYGKAHVGYIPSGKIVGLSKIPRVIDVFSRRLQVQERMTTQIAATLQKTLKPIGVGVVIEAHHLCMMMRGVEKYQSKTVTSSMLGSFRSNAKTRSEFLSLIQGSNSGL